MNVLWVVAAAFLGAVLTGLVGWLKTTEPFNSRKCLATVITAVFTAAGIGIAYTDTIVGPRELLMALAAGAGIDYARNVISGAIVARISGAIKAGLK